jgi:hypothetical protein
MSGEDELIKAALVYLGERKPAWDSRVKESEVVIIAHDGRKLKAPRAEVETVAKLMGKIERRTIRLLQENGILRGLATKTEGDLQMVPGIGKVTARKIVAAVS